MTTRLQAKYGTSPQWVELDATQTDLDTIESTMTSEQTNIDNLQAGLFTSTVVDVTGSTLAPSAGASGTVYLLNRAAGIAVTLPSAAAGLRYLFIAQTTVTGDYTFTAAAGDLLYGTMIMVDTDTSNTSVTQSPDASDDLILTWNGDTSGGLVGSWVEFIGMTATGWFVRGITRHSGNVGTAFS